MARNARINQRVNPLNGLKQDFLDGVGQGERVGKLIIVVSYNLDCFLRP